MDDKTEGGEWLKPQSWNLEPWFPATKHYALPLCHAALSMEELYIEEWV